MTIEAPVIMVVEDDSHIALALKMRLNASGYGVLPAKDVASALAIMEDQVPDITLLDVNLPDGNGLDLMETLLARVPPPSTVFIIMSASYNPELRRKALAKGAVAFLEKPFTSSDLFILLEKYTHYNKAC